jgi:pimeloyl-ACP methyl ester carboxylesterase
MFTSRFVRRMLLIDAVIVLLALGYFGIGWVAAERLTIPVRYHDPSVTPARHGGDFVEVTLRSSDGIDLAGSYGAGIGDRGLVLVHGRNSSRTRTFDGGFVELAARLQAEGWHVLLLDLRGHGASGDGRMAFGRTERLDVRAGVDLLIARGVAPGRIGVIGVSMGGATAIGAAADDPRIGALWLDAAYAEIDPLIRRDWSSASGLPDFILPGTLLMHRARFGFPLESARPIDEIARLSTLPIALVHGTGDALVPYEHAERLAAAYRADPVAYLERSSAFFAAALAPSSAGLP